MCTPEPYDLVRIEYEDVERRRIPSLVRKLINIWHPSVIWLVASKWSWIWGHIHDPKTILNWNSMMLDGIERVLDCLSRPIRIRSLVYVIKKSSSHRADAEDARSRSVPDKYILHSTVPCNRGSPMFAHVKVGEENSTIMVISKLVLQLFA